MKKGIDTKKFLFVKKWTIKKLTTTNNNVREIPRPEPKFKNIRDLSIISGSKAPIIRAIRLNRKFFLIYGISRSTNGRAM